MSEKLASVQTLSAISLMASAVERTLQALPRVWPWLAFYLAVILFFQWRGPQDGPALGFVWLLVFLAAYVKLSDALYRAMLPEAPPSSPKRLLNLAHSTISVWFALALVFGFMGFFLLTLPGILLEASGAGITGESTPEEVQSALTRMMPTPYGAVLIVCASGLLLFLLYVSLRLLLAGPATIVFDQTHAFRAWPMTKPVWKSALLATIVLLGPALALGAWADWSDRKAWLEHGTSQSRFGLTIFGILLLIFYFLGIFLQHALAVSAWRAAQPAIAPEDQSG